MSRHIVHASDDVVVERMRPEHVAAADELWLRNVDKVRWSDYRGKLQIKYMVYVDIKHLAYF